MRFRDDIDPAKTWIISDTHFGHKNIIPFCHRPDDFESLILENIVRDVPDEPDVTLLHLGDLCYKNNAMFRSVTSKHLPQNVRKLLILGNHDRQRYSFYKASGFKLARPFGIYVRLLGGGQLQVHPQSASFRKVSFSHYPWSDAEEGGPMPGNHVRIHGHIHNNGYTRDGFVPFLRNHINVSVEQTKYRPVNLKVLLDAALLGIYSEGDTAPNSIDAEAIEKETPHV